jgi:hypothetical protein
MKISGRAGFVSLTVLLASVAFGDTLVVPGVSSSPSEAGAFNGETGANVGIFALVQPGYTAIEDVAAENSGNVLLGEWTSSNNTGIFTYSSAGSLLGTFATLSGIVLDMSMGPDGNLYALVQGGSDFVDKFNGTTGALMSTPISGISANSVAVAPDGNILVNTNPVLNVYSSTGRCSTRSRCRDSRWEHSWRPTATSTSPLPGRITGQRARSLSAPAAKRAWDLSVYSERIQAEAVWSAWL